MKNYLTLKSVCGLAMIVLMTSCVAKRKYTEAQNTITQLQTENAQLKETGTTMQQNVVTLETQNRSLQGQLDSTNTWVSGQQSRWNSFQAFYDEGMRTTEQVHQQLHTQLDDLIGSENITTSNGRIHVNLAEATLFTKGSSKLTTKGADVLAQLAQVVKENPNVEIDIASAPGYYTASNMSSTTTDATITTDQSMNTDATKVKTDEDGDMKMKDGNTKVKVDSDGDVKVKTSGTKTKTSVSNGNYNRTYSGTAKKSTGTKSTARKSESKSKTYKSSLTRKSTSPSATWSLNMARSGAIAKKLVDEGVAKSRILVSNDNTSAAAAGTKDFQIIISPKAETYYNTIGNGMK